MSGSYSSGASTAAKQVLDAIEQNKKLPPKKVLELVKKLAESIKAQGDAGFY